MSQWPRLRWTAKVAQKKRPRPAPINWITPHFKRLAELNACNKATVIFSADFFALTDRMGASEQTLPHPGMQC